MSRDRDSGERGTTIEGREYSSLRDVSATRQSGKSECKEAITGNRNNTKNGPCRETGEDTWKTRTDVRWPPLDGQSVSGHHESAITTQNSSPPPPNVTILRESFSSCKQNTPSPHFYRYPCPPGWEEEPDRSVLISHGQESSPKSGARKPVAMRKSDRPERPENRNGGRGVEHGWDEEHGDEVRRGHTVGPSDPHRIPNHQRPPSGKLDGNEANSGSLKASPVQISEFESAASGDLAGERPLSSSTPEGRDAVTARGSPGDEAEWNRNRKDFIKAAAAAQEKSPASPPSPFPKPASKSWIQFGPNPRQRDVQPNASSSSPVCGILEEGNGQERSKVPMGPAAWSHAEASKELRGKDNDLPVQKGAKATDLDEGSAKPWPGTPEVPSLVPRSHPGLLPFPPPVLGSDYTSCPLGKVPHTTSSTAWHRFSTEPSSSVCDRSPATVDGGGEGWEIETGSPAKAVDVAEDLAALLFPASEPSSPPKAPLRVEKKPSISSAHLPGVKTERDSRWSTTVPLTGFLRDPKEELKHDMVTIQAAVHPGQYTTQRPTVKVVDQPLERPGPGSPTAGTSDAAVGSRIQLSPPTARKMATESTTTEPEDLPKVPPAVENMTVTDDDLHSFTATDGSLYKLHPYQVIGVKWLRSAWESRSGCILADEMGLGKTVQVCALLRELFMSGQIETSLILAPKSVLNQWEDHIKLIVPRVATLIYHGPSRVRQFNGMVQRYRRFALITTYETFRQDDTLTNAFEGEPWGVWVADEATAMKNPHTLLFSAVEQIQSGCCLLLTGTPIMNRYLELWSLMHLAAPQVLGPKELFVSTFDCLLDRQVYGTQSKRNALTRELRQLVLPYVLRRTKEEVFSSSEVDHQSQGLTRIILPSKTVVLVFQDLTPVQHEVYASIKRRMDLTDRRNVLVYITLLKKLCRHPVLCLPPHKQHWQQLLGDKAILAEEELGDMTGEDLEIRSPADSEFSPSSPVAPTPIPTNLRLELGDELSEIELLNSTIDQSSSAGLRESCPKMQALFNLLPLLHRGGHSTLVFSESTATLSLIEAAVLMELPQIQYRRIDGSLTLKRRQAAIRDFMENPDVTVVLLSTGAGGFGLNLVKADRVVIMDPSWNPAKDSQAIDRAHRIGQARPVIVFRFICGGAIEDNMMRLQLFKLNLSNSVLEGTAQKTWFTLTELRDLFSLSNCERSKLRQLMSNLTKDEAQLVSDMAVDLGEDPHIAFLAEGFASMDAILEEARRIKEEKAASRVRKSRPSMNGGDLNGSMQARAGNGVAVDCSALATSKAESQT